MTASRHSQRPILPIPRNRPAKHLPTDPRPEGIRSTLRFDKFPALHGTLGRHPEPEFPLPRWANSIKSARTRLRSERAGRVGVSERETGPERNSVVEANQHRYRYTDPMHHGFSADVRDGTSGLEQLRPRHHSRRTDAFHSRLQTRQLSHNSSEMSGPGLSDPTASSHARIPELFRTLQGGAQTMSVLPSLWYLLG
jgi:hypothetical protein